MKNRKILSDIGTREQAYRIGGVKYLLSTRFAPLVPSGKTATVNSRFAEIISNDFTQLTIPKDSATITEDHVCSTVGKEETCSRKETTKLE